MSVYYYVFKGFILFALIFLLIYIKLKVNLVSCLLNISPNSFLYTTSLFFCTGYEDCMFFILNHFKRWDCVIFSYTDSCLRKTKWGCLHQSVRIETFFKNLNNNHIVSTAIVNPFLAFL